MVVEVQRKRFSADEVLQMVELGLLGEERLELVDGELVLMSPKGTQHVVITSRLLMRLAAVAGSERWIVQEGTLRCADEIREPDVMVLRGHPDAYLHRTPVGSDVELAVEVSQSTQAYDRAKADVYARAGIPEYWLIDLAARRLERRRHPTPDGQYALVELLDASVSVDVLDTGETWPIAELLP